MKNYFWRLLLVGLMLIPSLVQAGGSITWDEVLNQIKKDDPFLANYITENFDMARSGGGIRVGHDKNGNSMVEGLGVGTRIPPYDFWGKPKGSKGDFNLHLMFEPIFQDDGSKPPFWMIKISREPRLF